MILKETKNRAVTIVVALFLALLLASAPTIIPAAHAGDCSTQTSGSC